VNGRRWLVAAGLGGIGAVLAYAGATVLGGILRPDYSHVSDDISKLAEEGAPHRKLLALLYGAYNLLLGLFATGLYRSSTRRRLYTIGWALLLVNCVSGLLQVTALRREPDGVPLTTAGKGHIAGAGISSLCTVDASWVLGLAFRRDAVWTPLSSFSLGSAMAVVATGLLAGASAATRSRFMGLFERITVGVFLLWVSVVSCLALRGPED
jgi:hypothetical protein